VPRSFAGRHNPLTRLGRRIDNRRGLDGRRTELATSRRPGRRELAGQELSAVKLRSHGSNRALERIGRFDVVEP
jgi:hypothetical protein